MNENSKSVKEEIEKGLLQFSGTESWHHAILNVYYTDGVKWLADNAKCYWLIDTIVSHLTNRSVRREAFQVWKLTVYNNKATLICEDGNNNKVLKQSIPYTDFPLDSITLWMEWGSLDGEHPAWVLMIPSER